MISHQHKIIYIHIPKCAGRSICDALQQPFDHYTASYYHSEFPQFWNDYTVFSTVRNPYQRLVSMYHYIKNEPYHEAHAITNFGNMLPFKNWVMENIALFKGEFPHPSTEGNREEDGTIGSPFWFSSQVSRLTNHSGTVYNDIHILRYEDGLQAVEHFLYQQAGTTVCIPHLNSSHSDSRSNYLHYYDQELLDVVNNFLPFITDCTVLNYPLIERKTSALTSERIAYYT